jgi:hypothetical protein
MNEIAGIPYTTAEFDERGGRIHQPVLPEGVSEIIVVSHGWNNERSEAEHLYRSLFANFARVNPGGEQGFAIVGVIWPSKKFDFSPDEAPAQDTGAVSAASTANGDRHMQLRIVEQSLAEFEKVFAGSGKQDALAQLRTLAPELGKPEAQARFVETLRKMVEDTGPAADLDGSHFFFEQSDAAAVFDSVKQPVADGSVTITRGAGGHGADAVSSVGIRSVLGGVGNAVSSLLNVTTYYEMKQRAGTVGASGLAPLIDQFGARDAVRHIHLVGHSFGARLVTAAAMASHTPKLYSLSLLQAAFSHNAFSKQGFFRQVLTGTRVAGPIIITHTRNDRAVGRAYAIASRLSGDAASDFGGGSGDKFGGLGSNGAVRMDTSEVSAAALQLLAEGKPYTLGARLIHNLESSAFISDHGDVEGPEVAWAISQAIASAGRAAGSP